MKRIHIQKALLLSLLFSSALFADIHDRIEYKLNRILRDIDPLVNGNTGDCTPITQADINNGSGVYTITQSGEYCVVENLVGEIDINVDSVCIDLNCHVVAAGENEVVFNVASHSGIRISNGTIANSGDAGVLAENCDAVELSNLYFVTNANDAIRLDTCTGVYVHNVNVFGGLGVRALGVLNSSNVVVANSEMTGYTASDANGILEILADSQCVAVQNVDVCSNEFTGNTPAGAIHVANSRDVVIEHSHANRTTSTESEGHGILIDTCIDCKVIGSQVHGNQDSGVELVGDNTCIALIECVAMENDFGFDFAQTSTATCCLVQDCRALSNTSVGFAHITTPLTTTFIGNEAQCNGDSGFESDYTILGGLINLQSLSWVDGSINEINGGAALGARFTNISASTFIL